MSNKQRRPAQIGGYWLSQRDNSPNWCRTWFDPATRQTRRASLGTSDLREAELKLSAWVAKSAEVRNKHPADLPLATVLTRYWHGHAINLPSATQAKIELRYWSDFFTTDMVADLTSTRQEAFVEHLRNLGHSTGYISRILSTGRAAIRRADKRGEVLAVPFIADVETAEDRRVKEPKGRPLTLEEIAALFDAANQHHVFIFLLLACCTLARPEAILDLTTFQRDREAGTIDLNPAGRRQTKKFRPLILEPETLTPWLDQAERAMRLEASERARRGSSRVVAPNYVAWAGGPLKSIKTAWRTLRDDAELDERVTPYSIRHTMAREMRRRRVPLEQRQAFLGHLPRGSARTTAIYAPDEPEYLSEAVEAIDAIMGDVNRAATQSIVWSLRARSVPVQLRKVVGAGGIEPPTPTMST
jgi:Phage integrase family